MCEFNRIPDGSIFKKGSRVYEKISAFQFRRLVESLFETLNIHCLILKKKPDSYKYLHSLENNTVYSLAVK